MKYEKYIIQNTPPNPSHPQNRNKVSNLPWMNTLWINNELQGKVKGAYYTETNLVLRPTSKEREGGSRPHNHDWDEYLLFIGTDPEDPFELGGEVDFWIEDEKYVINKTSAVFIPRGIYHCPIIVRKLTYPFVYVTTGNTLKYSNLSFSDNPRFVKNPFFDEIAEVSLGGEKYHITKTYADYLRWQNEKYRESVR